jgi:hypothetical protein
VNRGVNRHCPGNDRGVPGESPFSCDGYFSFLVKGKGSSGGRPKARIGIRTLTLLDCQPQALGVFADSVKDSWLDSGLIGFIKPLERLTLTTLKKLRHQRKLMSFDPMPEATPSHRKESSQQGC